MESITNLVNSQAQQLGQRKRLNESKACDMDLLKRIFATFSIVYGGSWDKNLATDELTSITKHVWQNGLKGLTREQIDHGLDNLQGEFAIPPQTFRAWCLGSDKGLTHNTAAYKVFDKSKAIAYDGDKKLAKRKIAEAYRILKGDRNIDTVGLA